MKQIIKTDEIPKNRQQSCIQQLNKQIEQQKIEKKNLAGIKLITIWMNKKCVSSGENETNWFGERTGRRIDDKETRDEEDPDALQYLDDLQDLDDLRDLQDADLSDTRSKVTETLNLVHHTVVLNLSRVIVRLFGHFKHFVRLKSVFYIFS